MYIEISAYEYMCTPMEKTFPIRSCAVTIHARTRQEADDIFHRYAYKFFEQDINVVTTVFGGGYRQTRQETN